MYGFDWGKRGMKGSGEEPGWVGEERWGGGMRESATVGRFEVLADCRRGKS